jgi:hypothetical protein
VRRTQTEVFSCTRKVLWAGHMYPGVISDNTAREIFAVVVMAHIVGRLLEQQWMALQVYKQIA